jgi:hypothetical protein
MPIQGYVVNEQLKVEISFHFCHSSFQFDDFIGIWPKEISVNIYQNFMIAYSIRLTFSTGKHFVYMMQMVSHQNTCTAVQYHFYGVAKSARVCYKCIYWSNFDIYLLLSGFESGRVAVC